MPADFPEVRASDADRDRTVDVLRGAVGDGRLTAEEFEERMGAALSSRTLGQLAELTADLGTVPDRPVVESVADARAQDVIRIDQRGGTIQRTGRWVVPRRLELRTSWCDVLLDFTKALIAADTLLIEMNMRGGTLMLVGGPGIVVDADDLAVRYTDVYLGSDAQPGTPVVLHVRLAGRMKYGSIEATR
jgi:hypothetical protein